MVVKRFSHTRNRLKLEWYRNISSNIAGVNIHSLITTLHWTDSCVFPLTVPVLTLSTEKQESRDTRLGVTCHNILGVDVSDVT